MDYTVINKCDFSGIVTSVKRESNGITLTVTQVVVERFETDFKVFIHKKFVDAFNKSGISEGDAVLVENALMYIKNEEFRFRLNDPKHLKKLVCAEPNHDLGTIEAHEKFI